MLYVQFANYFCILGMGPGGPMPPMMMPPGPMPPMMGMRPMMGMMPMGPMGPMGPVRPPLVNPAMNK